MKFFNYAKDGGPLSRVWGLYLVEIKSLFSIVLLRFKDGSREAFHTHAFHAVSWVLKGELVEHMLDGEVRHYRQSLIPLFTSRSCFHKVHSVGETLVITFRGPWVNIWKEYLPEEKRFLELTWGRKLVNV